MRFTVTYRDNAGTVKTAEIEASSRYDAFDLLKAKGIVPLQLVEAAVAHARHAGRRKASRLLLPAACAGAVIAVGVAALLLFSDGRGKAGAPAKNRSRRIAEVSSTKRGRTQADNIASGTSATQTGDESAAEKTDLADAAASKDNGDAPFPSNRVVAARGPSSGRKVTLMDGTETVVRQKPIFRRDFERMLMAASRPGGLTMDLSRMKRIYSETDIRRMLMEPVDIGDDDDEHVVVVKLRVQQAKEEIVEFLNGGGTIDEAIAQMQKQSRAENEERTASFKMLKELIADGNAEEIRNFVAERNKDHEKLGLPLLNVPGRFREDATAPVTSKGGNK